MLNYIRLFISYNFILLLIFTMSCSEATDPQDSSWQLVWSDEFEGSAGSLPDLTKWKFDVGTDWGNAQLEYDTDRPENASLDGEGHLAIVARKESYMGSAYTSARIITKDLYETAYGRIEARIKLPFGQGLWPAFWMLGNNIDVVGWPNCGEIDIMEYRGQKTSRVHGSLHGPGYSGGSPVTGSYDLQNDRFDRAFHLFAVEWEKNQISFFVDDTRYLKIDRNDVPGTWVFDHPFFIILNLAVGGHFVGPPDASTTFPQTLLIDYVRVYKKR
jgi:beta-glucanase (GH16 family)